MCVCVCVCIHSLFQNVSLGQFLTADPLSHMSSLVANLAGEWMTHTFFCLRKLGEGAFCLHYKWFSGSGRSLLWMN